MPLIKKTGLLTPVAGVGIEEAEKNLAQGSPDERWAAARALGAVPGGGAETLAAALAREPDIRVREAIFSALARLDSDASFEAILVYLRADDAAARSGAIDALRLMPAMLTRRLEDLLHDADADVRVLACDLARAIDRVAAQALLVALLAAEPDQNICAAAVDVLAEIGDPDVLPVLRTCAARFAGAGFLAFSIGVAAARISGRRG
jgi:HEAT repeat protein